jgi:hypothetical protein
MQLIHDDTTAPTGKSQKRIERNKENFIILIIINVDDASHAGHLNSFVYLSALLWYSMTRHFWPRQQASLLGKRGGARLVCGKRCAQGGIYTLSRYLLFFGFICPFLRRQNFIHANRDPFCCGDQVYQCGFLLTHRARVDIDADMGLLRITPTNTLPLGLRWYRHSVVCYLI